MRTIVLYVCIGLLLTGWGTARAVSPTQLAGELRTILQNASPKQNHLLLKWKQKWEQAGYVKDSVYVKALLQIGMLRYLDNQYPDAAAVVEQAVRVCRTNRTGTRPADLSKALYRLGVVGIAQNLTDRAITVLKQAVVTGRNDAESATWVSNAHLYLAYCYDTKSDYQQMITQADMGLQTSAHLDNKPLTANLLRQKAQALTSLQRYAEARQTIEQAIQLGRNEKGLTAAFESDNYSLLSVILGHQNQPDQALTYARQAFDLAKQINSYHKTDCAIRVSFLLNQTGQYEQAREYSDYVIVHGTDRFKRAEAFQLTGVSYWKQTKYGQALQSYQRGITELPIGFSAKKIEQLPSNGQIRLIAQKEVLFTLLRDKASTWLDSAKAANHPRCLRYALQTYEVADQLIDYMRWDHTADQSKLFWREKTRGIYERAIQTCVLLNDTEQAFRFFEKSRAVMLADKLNELGARQQLPEAQANQEKKLRAAVSEQQSKLATLTPDSARYKPISDSLFERQDKLDAFLKQLEASNPAYYRYKYDTTTTKLADLQGHLAVRNASFVTYFIGDSALYLLGVTGDRATLRRQPIWGYNQRAQKFMGLLADPVAMNRTANVAQFLKSGNALYRQLLAPLNLPEGSVIVSSDGSIIPFEVLSRSARESDYLVKNYAFSYTYSARLLLKTTADHDKTASFIKNDFLGIAPVSFSPRLGQVSLLNSDEALKPIADRFRSSALFTGPEATRQTFVTEATHARVIHLFTHATADTSSNEPLLYFADSTLRLSELGDGGLMHTELAVLAACKTGVGINQRGEGVFSLARGLAALGVPSVLTTLWSVENKATYTITDLFYQYLDQGLPKDVALQRAKRDWLKNHEGTDQSPNVWAGLILVGDTEPPSRPVQWAWVAGGTLLLLITAGMGLWWWRRRIPG